MTRSNAPAPFVAMVACLLGLASAAHGSPITYDMPNGDGRASGGTYNYWDAAYTGSGSTTTDGAALASGTGKLTDGIASAQVWTDVSNIAGTGAYVGWNYWASPNPAIVFHLAESGCACTVSLLGMTIWLDNSHVGGVGAPAGIAIDGHALAFAAPATGTVGAADISLAGLGLTGPTHTVQLFQDLDQPWSFVSEVGFTLGTSVPEPRSLAMFALALVSLAGFGGRRAVLPRA